MREILFRGFNANHMGDETIRVDGSDFTGYWIKWDQYGKIVSPSRLFGGRIQSPELVLVKPETVGQFTGLLDKNGKRIFEGDRCVHHGGTDQAYEGFWKNDEFYCQFVFFGEDTVTIGACNHYLFTIDSPNLEVIGTIFDKEADA